MGQGPSGGLNRQGDRKPDGGEKKEKKFEPAAPPARVGRKQRKQKGPEAAARLPTVTPTKCKLRLLKLERIKDYLLMEEEFVANQERLKPQEEKAEEDRSKVDDLRGTPMSVGNLEELIDENHAIVSSSVGPEYYVGILSFVDKDQLEPGCSILMHNKVLSVVGILQDEVDPMVSVMKVEKAPLESYADIGGLEAQIQEIKEAVELPLTHPELYEDIGIKPPKGVILYGEPGTGKTLLAKAVANSTSATFLRVVGSELIQKYLGDGPKLVRELFRVADDLSPSIVFIDEIDAVGTKRYDANSGGEREIQRTMLELLNQLDGFDSRGDVKVILATNRIESLDPALLRPGRIDRKIEFPLPDIKTRRRIFQIHTSKMTLAEDVNLEEFVMTKDEFSGADIKAICTEAGLLALRERRMKVTHVDFKKAKEKVMFKKKEGVPEGLYMSKDTRDNFVSHLCGCLRRKRIKTFLYDELPADERYEESLKAIEVSKISVIVFSENFGDSRWCLDEVVAILKCKEKFGQIVIPVLYHVDPLDIENQTGSFGDAFAKRRDKAEQLQEWKDSFTEAINLPGWSTAYLSDEEMLVNGIAREIENKLLRASRTKVMIEWSLVITNLMLEIPSSISYTKAELTELCGSGLGPFLGFTIKLKDQTDLVVFQRC
ncbi:unnamed protein product [Arabidopsis thaliana]|uniref:(thale cress) hypothetical protein n=1 Tax=Arabidopsis thaliana TaxID=3702 RepID=A0A7G2EDI7_ARATH|nr:unnamed protein product [Arabidopsis thaliana]